MNPTDEKKLTSILKDLVIRGSAEREHREALDRAEVFISALQAKGVTFLQLPPPAIGDQSLPPSPTTSPKSFCSSLKLWLRANALPHFKGTSSAQERSMKFIGNEKANS